MDPLALQRIALDVAAARSVEQVLAGVVAGVLVEGDVALGRIWLVDVGDICADCPLLGECPDQSRCLHLVASAGRSLHDDSLRWDGLDGRYRRFPLNVRKVGRIGGSGQAELRHIDTASDWLVDPEWAAAEGLKCFAGQPLVFRGEVLGVLAVFSRSVIDDEAFGWLRTFADHAAVAIANARAFEELGRLQHQLSLERDYLREEAGLGASVEGIIGTSAAIRKTLSQVEMVASTDASVLVLGESGTGKELVASAIHARSQRREGPFVRVNCAAIPDELFESEFFGHVKGAFTGAATQRAGRFSVADGGTLFLDEVAEIPLALQGKLLRVLQEGQLSPVGSDDVRTVDVRVLTATNRDLRAEVEAGRFREDLYYRLSVFPIEVPSLRERLEDVPALAAHFLTTASRCMNCPEPKLTRAAVQRLLAYDWPGNVRELQNVIERAVITAGFGKLVIDLPDAGRAGARRSAARAAALPEGDRILTEDELRQLERRNLEAALERAGGKVSGPGGAAELLGLRPTTLTSRLKTLGVRRRS